MTVMTPSLQRRAAARARSKCGGSAWPGGKALRLQRRAAPSHTAYAAVARKRSPTRPYHRVGPHCTGKPRGSGWDSGRRTELPITHALPQCLPTPNSVEADGNGYGAIAGRGSLGPPPRVSVNLVPLLWTGVPTRHDKNICQFFGCPGLPGFP